MAAFLDSEVCRNTVVSFVAANRWAVMAGVLFAIALFTIFIVSRITQSTLLKNEKALWISMAALHLVVLVSFFIFGVYFVFRCAS